METLLLNGKRYMKASSASRETGYTMDYIGQLCRRKKIDAQLVGRTWYVLESEMAEHRRTRGRSSSAKVREAVHKAVADSAHSPRLNHPEYRKRLIAHEVRYHTDDSELLPTLAPRHLEVKSNDKETAVLARSESGIVVTSEEKESSLKPVRRAHTDIKWNGTIVVSPLDEQAPEEEPPESDAKKETHIEPIVEEGGRSVSVRVMTDAATDVSEAVPDADEGAEREAEAEEVATEDEQEVQIRMPQKATTVRPAFIDRLNHAHVLNELDPEASAAETQEEPKKKRAETRLHSSKGLALTALVGVTSIIIVFSNILIERVVYVDRDVRGQDEYRMMSLRYDFISAAQVGTKAAAAVTALRNIYDFSDSSAKSE